MFPFAFSFLVIDSLLLFKIISEYRRQVLAFLVSKRFYACMINKETQTKLTLQILVNSIHDPKVGIIFDPKSLIEALSNVVGRYMSANITVA